MKSVFVWISVMFFFSLVPLLLVRNNHKQNLALNIFALKSFALKRTAFQVPSHSQLVCILLALGTYRHTHADTVRFRSWFTSCVLLSEMFIVSYLLDFIVHWTLLPRLSPFYSRFVVEFCKRFMLSQADAHVEWGCIFEIDFTMCLEIACIVSYHTIVNIVNMLV